MSHKEQRVYCLNLKDKYPEYFNCTTVLDVGSRDVNGNNRHLFYRPRYTGIDIVAGKNVDIIGHIHSFHPYREYDVIICTEMLEHDRYFYASLDRMIDLLVSNGLLIITAAGIGREPHGITGSNPKDSPATLDYYMNVTQENLKMSLHQMKDFSMWQLEQDEQLKDIYFYGIKH